MNVTLATEQPAAQATVTFHFQGYFQLEAIQAEGRWFFCWWVGDELVELDPSDLGSRACN